MIVGITKGGSSPAAVESNSTVGRIPSAPSESCTMGDFNCSVHGCKQVFYTGQDQGERRYNHLAHYSTHGSQQAQHFQAYSALITGKYPKECLLQAIPGDAHTIEVSHVKTDEGNGRIDKGGEIGGQRWGGSRNENGECGDPGYDEEQERAYIMYYAGVLISAFNDTPEFAVPPD